jgi:acyl-CoA reductase-like NAD-dependent aldehyde dehydrogenase
VVVEEAFGPVLPLLKFSDIDDVIARVNASDYGLAASVWGKDVAIARKIVERLEAGAVWVNEIHSFSPHVAFGGHKQSVPSRLVWKLAERRVSSGLIVGWLRRRGQRAHER